MNTETRVLADDLSGALDASAYLFGKQKASVGWSGPQADVSVLTTNNRDLTQHEAAERMRQLTDWLMQASLRFMKCDSRLRGHVAAEIDALITVGSPHQIIIAPALPAMNRIMKNGQLRSKLTSCDGWTMEPTDLTKELSSFGHFVVCGKPKSQNESGIFLCDSQTDGDLDAIVEHGSPNTVWCGSSGLAAALGRRYNLPLPVSYPLSSPTLFLIGTNHPQTIAQISAVEGNFFNAICNIGQGGDGINAVAKRLASRKPCLVTVKLSHGEACSRASETIDTAFALLLAKIPRPASLVVTGGATLQSVARSLGAMALRIEGELVPGVPVSRLVSGRWDGLPVASKSGGFGDTDLFSKILNLQD